LTDFIDNGAEGISSGAGHLVYNNLFLNQPFGKQPFEKRLSQNIQPFRKTTF
jgi:hypothetical protein